MAANRLDQFREHMARLDASAGPQETIQEGGYYVAPPGKSIADELAKRLSLKPLSSHIVLGGVGSGKTTQLALVCEQLNHIEDTRAIYIDVSERYDLHALRADDLEMMLTRELVHLTDPSKPKVIMVLDSLDRLNDMRRFEDIVTTWPFRLATLNLGVVLTAPLAVLYGTRRSLLDRVDRYYHLPWMDVRDGENRDFLERVLGARIPESLCPAEPRGRLVELSGGVLRDLVALTQSAVEEAYVQGEDVVTVEQVELVADAFGRKHLLGLDADDLALLQKVRTSGSFVPTSDEHLALVHTRRVLEYRQGARIHYRVHPTIEALLAELAAP